MFRVHGISAWLKVSTHSRLKAVDGNVNLYRCFGGVSTHSHPKAAEHDLAAGVDYREVSTHSRPRAADYLPLWYRTWCQFQHTAARGRLTRFADVIAIQHMFQHTAA